MSYELKTHITYNWLRITKYLGGQDMQTFLKISIFAVIALLGYTLFANVGIPQVRPAPPPAEEETIGAMSMDQYIVLGKKIFEGKGTCTLCHNPVLGGRAPNIINMHATSEERLKDPAIKERQRAARSILGNQWWNHLPLLWQALVRQGQMIRRVQCLK